MICIICYIVFDFTDIPKHIRRCNSNNNNINTCDVYIGTTVQQRWTIYRLLSYLFHIILYILTRTYIQAHEVTRFYVLISYRVRYEYILIYIYNII